jgi:hypothetical protein
MTDASPGGLVVEARSAWPELATASFFHCPYSALFENDRHTPIGLTGYLRERPQLGIPVAVIDCPNSAEGAF